MQATVGIRWPLFCLNYKELDSGGRTGFHVSQVASMRLLSVTYLLVQCMRRGHIRSCLWRLRMGSIESGLLEEASVQTCPLMPAVWSVLSKMFY